MTYLQILGDGLPFCRLVPFPLSTHYQHSLVDKHSLPAHFASTHIMSTANSNSSPSALPPVIHFSSSTIPANYPESAIRSTVNLNFPASSNALRTTERGLAQKNNQPRDQHSHLRHVDSKPNNSPRNAPSERVPPPTCTQINVLGTLRQFLTLIT